MATPMMMTEFMSPLSSDSSGGGGAGSGGEGEGGFGGGGDGGGDGGGGDGGGGAKGGGAATTMIGADSTVIPSAVVAAVAVGRCRGSNRPPRACPSWTTCGRQQLPPGCLLRLRVAGGSSLGWLWVKSALLSAHPEALSGAAALRRDESDRPPRACPSRTTCGREQLPPGWQQLTEGVGIAQPLHRIAGALSRPGEDLRLERLETTS
jgi:hypothetical protein